MSDFLSLIKKLRSSPQYDQMLKFVEPLRDFLGINHIWYYKITNAGEYVFLGTHTEWCEFCFDQDMTRFFPCLRHPSILQSKITLMKATEDSDYKKVLEIAWKKFAINFSINLTEKVQDGVEAFGFATRFNDPKAEERLLNELPFLQTFTKIFRQKYNKLFQLIEENRILLPERFGGVFFEQPKQLSFPDKRHHLLSKLGFAKYLCLTPREIDIMKYMLYGYPACYIGKDLRIAEKTVENYLAVLKDKLGCHSKIELIEKAKEIYSLGLL